MHTWRCRYSIEKLIQWRGGEFIDETSESWLQLHGAICLRRRRSYIEQLFSGAGKIVTDKRCKLSAEKTEMLLALKYNLPLLTLNIDCDLNVD